MSSYSRSGWKGVYSLVSDGCATMLLFNTHIPLLVESWSYAARIPNVNCQIDKGEDLFTIWTPFWADDVSGARSKQYQKHINVYMMNANLPGQLLQQEYFVRFVSTSQNAGALEQLRVVTNEVRYVSGVLLNNFKLIGHLGPLTSNLCRHLMQRRSGLVAFDCAFQTFLLTILSRPKRHRILVIRETVNAVSASQEERMGSESWLIITMSSTR